MKLTVVNGTLAAGSVFKLIAIGWFFGWGALFAILLIPVLIFGLIALASSDQLRTEWTNLAAVFMLPIVLALQAIMVGAIGAFGYIVFKRYRSIELETKTSVDGADGL